MLANLGPISLHLGPISLRLGPISPHLDHTISPRESLRLGRTTTDRRSTWADLGRIYLGRTSVHLGRNSLHLGRIWAAPRRTSVNLE